MSSLRDAAEWVVKRISALTRTATNDDLTDSEYMAVDNPSAYTRKITMANLATWVLGRSESLKFFVTTNNPEYVYAITDDADRFLFGIKKDGSVNWAKGLPDWLNSRLSEIDGKVDKAEGQSLVDSIFANGVSVVSNDNYLFAIVDSTGRILFGIDKNGKYELTPYLEKELANKLYFKVDKVGGKGLINDVFADGIEVSSDEHHLLIITDKLNRVLLSVTNEGYIEQLQSGLAEKVNKEVGKSLIDLSFSKAVSFYSDERHLLVVADKNLRCLFAIRDNGELELPFIPDIILEQLNNKVDKVNGKTLLSTKLAETLGINNTTEYLYTITDNFGRFIAGVKVDGTFHINKLSANSLLWSKDNLNELREALAANGVNLASVNQYDWSDANELHIAVPQIAIVNLTSTRALPQYKGDKVNAELEFWDLNGNYFKKKVIIDVQGNSTQWFPKKNFTFDLCNDDWVGDDTFSLKFGRWVEQDSYHLKAFWVDMFRGGIAQAYYKLLDEIWQHKRGPLNVPWLKAKVNSDYLTNRGYGCSYNFGPTAFNERINSGATCHPEGFPCLVHYNGSFWGVYSFAIKKHRKNYHMDKKNYNEILIDGVLHANTFWNGAVNISWNAFELKNPKTLITMDGSKYDGDNPKELIDSSSPSWTNSKDQKNTQKTKQAIQALSNVMPQIISAVNTYGVNSQEVIDLYERYFDVDNLIDYILFSDVILDTDTGANNVLWTTWDGVKWYACPYDIDRVCGTWGGYLTGNAGTSLLNRQGLPTYYIGQNATLRARLVARYAELRTDGIFEQNHLWSICKQWADAVGVDNYEKEWTKWPENIVNNNAVVNMDYWQIVLDSDGNPELSQNGTWSNITNYVIGDEVFYGPGNVSGLGTASGYYKFVCIAPNTNQPPFSELRCRDSLWRLYAWFGRQLQAMDIYYNYTNT